MLSNSRALNPLGAEKYMLFGNLLNLKEDQILNFNYFDNAKIYIGDTPCFTGKVGQLDENIAVKVKNNIDE